MLREKKGLTQEEAAEAIGVHAKHVGRLEGGTGNPTISTLVAFALAYGVQLGALFESDAANTEGPRPARPR